ncbi:hypothetical protein FGL68_07105 [Acinetobacter baumannii]|nr:hypothetical protein [Acinetobacter baumannii]
MEFINNCRGNRFNKVIFEMMNNLNNDEMNKINELTSKFNDDEMDILREISEFYFRAGLKEGIDFKKYLI